jgi:flavin-dependent dehydrogenase
MLPPAAQSDDGGTVPERDCDVIVFGGGPAGAAAGLALARKGLSVVVFAKPRTAPYIGETVAPNIVRPLARLGVWDAFLDAAHAAVPGTVVVWGDEHPFENDFLFNPYGPGWHLDRAAFDAMLIEAAQAAGADLRPAPVRDCVRKPCGGWTALFDDQNGGGALSARWVIDATGRTAWFAKRNGGEASSRRPVGRVCQVRLCFVHQRDANAHRGVPGRMVVCGGLATPSRRGRLLHRRGSAAARRP